MPGGVPPKILPRFALGILQGSSIEVLPGVPDMISSEISSRILLGTALCISIITAGILSENSTRTFSEILAKISQRFSIGISPIITILQEFLDASSLVLHGKPRKIWKIPTRNIYRNPSCSPGPISAVILKMLSRRFPKGVLHFGRNPRINYIINCRRNPSKNF